MKEISMDIDECRYIINELLDFILNDIGRYNEIEKENACIDFLKHINREIGRNWDIIEFVQEKLEPILTMIGSIGFENLSEKEFHNFKYSIWELILSARNSFYHQSLESISRNTANSMNFYDNQIAKLKKGKDELEKILEKTKADLNKKSAETEEIEKQAKRINLELQKYEKQLALKKKEEDAKSNWEEKINSTFIKLKEYLKPVTDEKNRLNVLFWIYSSLAVLTVMYFIVAECIAIYKITSIEGFPDFKQYLTIFLPIPIAGGLFWGSITQINRAQRQLVLLAKSIHDVEYIHGLLLSINNLSPSIEDAISRINLALDKLIENHLGQEEVCTETEIINEEKKDSLPIESVLKILKEAKSIIKE